MKILLHEDVKLEFADLRRRVVVPPQTAPRSPGVHLSGVLKQWAMEAEILTPSEWAEEEEGVYPLRMFMGNLWEEGVASLYETSLWWPGELKRDGVIGTHDGEGSHAPPDYMPSADDVMIEEVKFTHKSCSGGRDVPNLASRQGVVDWWRWLQQGMGYLNMHIDRPRLVRYHVLYANGDYQRPYRERYVRTLVEFSEQELAANWRSVLKYKGRTQRES